MKTFTNIILLAGLTVGVFTSADAQRGRGGNGSSSRSGDRGGGERRETSTSSAPRGGGNSTFRPGAEIRGDRGNFGNRGVSPVNRQVDRQVFTNRENDNRNSPGRNDAARFGQRDTRVTADRTNRIPGGQYYRGNSGYNNNRYNNNNRYDNNNRYNNNRYNNNYVYNNNRYGNSYYRTGYYRGGYNRGYSFAYGPRFSIIPRNHISIYFGGNPYYYYNGFYYGYYGGYYEPIFPPLGLRIGFLPYGYTSLFIGGYPYYYYNGTYYRHGENDYEVVDPPMGANVFSLPKGAKSVLLNGEKMYELNGTYYKEGRSSKGEVIYTVVGKNGEINNTDDDGAMQNNVPPVNNDAIAPPASLQMGDVVTQLPEGSKIVTINGEKMYVSPDDTYLREESNEGTVQYTVVGIAK